MWAEEFSRFSSLAPQNFLQFVVHVHVSFHNSASHSICAAQTEWLTFKMYYTDIYMTWVTPKTKAESYHEDFKSLLVVHKKTIQKERKFPEKQGKKRDVPAHLKSVDGCTKCRFHLIKSWREITLGHFDVLLIYLLWKICRVQLPETFTNPQLGLAE